MAPIASQIAGDLVEDARLPQRQPGADEQDEVTDEVEFQEFHASAVKHEGCLTRL